MEPPLTSRSCPERGHRARNRCWECDPGPDRSVTSNASGAVHERSSPFQPGNSCLTNTSQRPISARAALPIWEIRDLSLKPMLADLRKRLSGPDHDAVCGFIQTFAARTDLVVWVADEARALLSDAKKPMAAADAPAPSVERPRSRRKAKAEPLPVQERPTPLPRPVEPVAHEETRGAAGAGAARI